LSHHSLLNDVLYETNAGDVIELEKLKLEIEDRHIDFEELLLLVVQFVDELEKNKKLISLCY
jgi:hypothetical protein